VDALIDRIEALVGRPVRREHLRSRPFDVSANVLDISLAARVLDWRPQITLEAGLARLADQMRAASRPDQPTASAR
jgi:UDP-glucose 4-epimerase